MSAHHGRNVGGDHLPGQPGVEDAIREANDGKLSGDDADAPETVKEYVEEQEQDEPGGTA